MKIFFQDGYPMLYSTRPAPVVRPGSPDILNLIVTMAIFVHQGTLVYIRRALTPIPHAYQRQKSRTTALCSLPHKPRQQCVIPVVWKHRRKVQGKVFCGCELGRHRNNLTLESHTTITLPFHPSHLRHILYP